MPCGGNTITQTKQKEGNAINGLLIKMDLQNYEATATLKPHISYKGWFVAAKILKPRHSTSGYILAVREQATGFLKNQQMKSGGLAYWNHALFYHISNIEAREFTSICDDADNSERRFQKFYAQLSDKALSVRGRQYSVLYAVAVYGGLDGNTLKGYITTPPTGFGAQELKKLYNLWSWTKVK